MLMESLLFNDGLVGCIENPPDPVAILDKKSEVYELDALARTRIITSMEPRMLQYLTGSTTAFGHWMKLCKVFEDSGVYRRIAIKRQLFSLRQGTKGLTEYVLESRDLVNRLAAIGHPIEEETAAFLLLEHVNQEHRGLCQILERTAVRATADGGSEFDYERVAEELTREGVKGESAEGAKVLKAGPPRRRFPRQGGSSGQQHGGPSGRRQGGGDGGSSGRQHGGARTQQTTRQQSRDRDDKDRDDRGDRGGDRDRHQKFPLCKWCKNPLRNHPEARCYFNPHNPQGNGAKRARDDNGEERGKRKKEGNNNNGSSKWVLKMARMAVNHDPKANNKTLEMYIDSGAFQSMCNDKTSMHNYKNQPSVAVECAGDQILHTKGSGTLKLNPEKLNGLSEIQNVTYVPNLSSNLLSVSSIAKSGLATVFIDNLCSIYKKEDIVLRGEPLLSTVESNGTYKLNLEVQPNVALKTSCSEAEVWHKRLGHLGKNSLELLKTGLVEGFTDKTLKLSDSCDPCLKSRQVRASFPVGEATRAKDVLEIIHSDVCEVTDSLTWDGHRYFVTFIDDLTRFTMIGLLKTKNEVFEKFVEYKTLVERQTGKKIKTLRSDNGGEYCSKEFNQYLKSEGILRQFSVAYTPEQNGVGERCNRTAMEKVRAMLKECGLDDRYWGEALSTAVYLKNLSPTKAVQGMVPYEAWTGVKPNVKDLKVFGCCAYVHVPKTKSKKLGDRSKMCIFIGYDDEKKGFRLVDMARPRDVFVERSVYFDEHKFPALELKTKNPETESRKVQGESNNYHQIMVGGNSIKTNKTNKTPSLSSFGDDYSTTSVPSLSSSGDDRSTSSPSELSEGRTTSIDIDNISESESTEPLRSTNKNHETNKRQRTPKKFGDFEVYGIKKNKTKGFAWLAASTDQLTPTTLAEALNCPEADFWVAAMTEELDSFDENGVWDLVPHQADNNIVGTKWVYKRKIDANNKVLFRARLVAKGFTQTYGVDYFEIYAPVVRRTALRLLFSVAVNFDLKIDHLDVKTAFLHGDLSETVYMAQPEGFVSPGQEGMICKLNKAVYGLKQAARSWNLKVDKIMKEQGFKNFCDEPCIYIKNHKGSVIIIALYVDDFYLVYNNNQDKQDLLRILNSHFRIKDLGEAKNCLGIKLERNWKNGSMVLHQEDYINHLLLKFNMTNCNPRYTPLESGLKIKTLNPGVVKTLPYQELIGCLLYLSVNTRPDISYAVSFLGQFNSCYTTLHWNLAKGLLHYLKLTASKGLLYTKSAKPTFCLTGFADADFANNPDDFRSYSGYCFTLDGNLISWESKKQKLTAQSTTESEYIAMTEAVKESIWLNELVGKLFECGKQTITVYNDNLSAITLAYSKGFSARTKHMGVRLQFVRDCVEDGSVKIEHMSTDLMPADVLTKALKRDKHEKCCKYLKMTNDSVPTNLIFKPVIKSKN